jgi:hypothetical protein
VKSKTMKAKILLVLCICGVASCTDGARAPDIADPGDGPGTAQERSEGVAAPSHAENAAPTCFSEGSAQPGEVDTHGEPGETRRGADATSDEAARALRARDWCCMLEIPSTGKYTCNQWHTAQVWALAKCKALGKAHGVSSTLVRGTCDSSVCADISSTPF